MKKHFYILLFIVSCCSIFLNFFLFDLIFNLLEQLNFTTDLNNITVEDKIENKSVTDNVVENKIEPIDTIYSKYLGLIIFILIVGIFYSKNAIDCREIIIDQLIEENYKLVNTLNYNSANYESFMNDLYKLMFSN